MPFFNPCEPMLRPKQHDLEYQDLKGLWHVHWQIGSVTLLQSFFTRIDQVFLIWGLLTLIIFGTAQFLYLDWTLQAEVWGVLALVGLVLMAVLSWCWVAIEKLSWLLGYWVLVVGVGVVLTYLSITQVWEGILLHLGPFWLMLSALGYLGTGLALRSRALLLAAVLHGMSAWVFMGFTDWQFLGTALVHGGSLFLLGAYQWDMYLPHLQPIPDPLVESEKVYDGPH